MLSKTHRFNSSDFVKIKKFVNQKVHTKYGVFLLYTKKINKNLLLQNKFAIILPSSIFQTAVFRNKQKRLFFNTLYTFLQKTTKENPPNFSLLFYPKRFFTEKDLMHDLSQIFSENSVV